MRRAASTRRWALGLLFFSLAAGTASAHLGGTGSVDQVARLTLSGDSLTVVFELDMAEFPAQALRKTFDRMRDLRIDAQEEQQGLRALSREVLRAISMTLDGQPLRLRLKGRPVIETPDRTTGAIPLKVRFVFRVDVPAGLRAGTLVFRNRLYADRVGFVRAHLDAGAGLEAGRDASVATTLDRYEKLNTVVVEGTVKELPKGEDPPQFREMTWRIAERQATAPPVEPGTAPAEPATASRDPAFADRQAKRFWEFFRDFDQASNWVVLGFVLLAFVYGMGHALTPGHGKAITAAFLIGNRGTIKDALILGFTVTATHTVAVFTLGIAAEIATYTFRRDKVIWWLELLSALLIVGLGLFIFWRHLLALARGTEVGHDHVHLLGGHTHPPHGHDHGDHLDHGHAHDHGHPHTHAHAHVSDSESRDDPAHRSPQGAQGAGRPSLWQTIYLGITGGMIPCPTGLVIVSVSFQYHLLGLGLFLAAVFSLGMAGVLVAIGIFTVKGFKVAERYGSRRALIVFRVMPVLSGAFISLLGLGFLATTFGWIDWSAISGG